ncbi:hypothetical protein E4U09_001847 [Claviceps aff. purpurea]|uniref:Glycinamide ribonucleotide synthetase n=1 Tax=Claviceps aff. purpurea TaxID=1967640 RepID=A0A9P7U6A5_9HYPO|nr:hypothetical protein E4U09_001847 [Claviceps aff. purpurea]
MTGIRVLLIGNGGREHALAWKLSQSTVMPLLSVDTDLAEIMLACTEGYLGRYDLKIDPIYSATVVVAAGGYPGSYAKGDKAGRRSLQSSGERVIAVNSVGESLRSAVDASYAALATGVIKFDHMFFRKDIAHRAFRMSLVLVGHGLMYRGGMECCSRDLDWVD